jgi:plastocyanin
MGLSRQILRTTLRLQIVDNCSVRSRWFQSPIVALVLLTAACSGGSSARTPPTSGLSATTGAGRSTLSCQQAQATITQQDFRFDPAHVSVGFCAIIAITNSSPGTRHTFTVPDRGIDVAIDPGQSRQLQLLLPPGTYTFVCRFHERVGMKGTLTVVG